MLEIAGGVVLGGVVLFCLLYALAAWAKRSEEDQQDRREEAWERARSEHHNKMIQKEMERRAARNAAQQS
jgi:hypothetical protein